LSTNRSFAQSIWDFFCSLKLTIALLISLALTSIIGTVLPQGQLPPEYVAQISQTKLQIYTKLSFFDMYHSWWFIALLCIFSLNLTCCSIKRLPHVFKFISQPMLMLSESMRNSFALKQEITFSIPSDAAREKLSQFLQESFSAPVITEQDGEFHLFAQKSAWCRLGVYVVHLSILIIFVGAIIGSLFGYKAFVNIVEGTSVTSVQDRSGKEVPLGFEVLCSKFDVDFYSNGAPKEFRSILTVKENGQPVPGYQYIKIIVNKPLQYKGITFYQSSYGKAEEGGEHFFSVSYRSGGTPERFPLMAGATKTFNNGTTFKVLETTEDVSQFIPNFSGPAARIEVTRKGQEPATFIIFQKFPEVGAQRGDEMTFIYEGSNAKMYTGLQVAKDPGVWTVWLGCTLMIIGIFIAFFMSHKRVWIVVSKGRARMYGNASKNQAAFSMQFDTLSDKLKELKF